VAAQRPDPPCDKTIIYLDRNNTPDIWSDIRKTIVEFHAGKPKDWATVILLPKQEDWDRSQYKTLNPICPHLIYECCKRIFNRTEHGCLNSSNKPKVIDVILKFAKLHDGFDFEKMPLQYFDFMLNLDFLCYSTRKHPLLPETLQGMIRNYNLTPDNFGSPSEEVVADMISLVDH
jgi:hypothetical protein